ncbi:MAG TPA: BrnT family toxin [Phycisphaerales bacterium]|nr:BrnT family toxin [Phycisphaerales bacterium]
MRFEFDPRKSDSNKARHGIDFRQAQAMWDDPDVIEVPLKTDDDPRFLVVGRIGQKQWAAIITYRGDAIRLISVRRARKEEVSIYEGS